MRRTALALLVAASVGAIVTPSVARAQSGASVTARDEFHAGQSLFDQRRYAEALVRFEASLAALASPNTLLYIARCESALGQVGRAYRHFDQAAREANSRRGVEARFQETFLSATSERDLLEPRVAFLTVRTADETSTTGPALTINGDRIDGVSWGALIAVDPGPVDITVAVDSAVRRRTLTLIAGATGAWNVDFGGTRASPVATVPNATIWSPVRVAGITLASLGVVSLISAAATGSLAEGAYANIMVECGSSRCPQSRAAEVASGEALVAATNVLVGAGIVLTLGGGLAAIFAPTGPRTQTPAVAVLPVLGGGVVTLSGRF